MSAFDNDYGDDEAWDRAQAKVAMSEAKSLVVWKRWDAMHADARQWVREEFLETWLLPRFEYAHDLSGRFLGVFREVQK